MAVVAQVSRVARVGLRLLDLGGRSVPGSILVQGIIRMWHTSRRILRINDRLVTKFSVRPSSEDVARCVPSGTGCILPVVDSAPRDTRCLEFGATAPQHFGYCRR